MNRQRRIQRQGHRNHWGHDPSTNQQSATCQGHRLFFTARTFRQCPTIKQMRRPTLSDALWDERAN